MFRDGSVSFVRAIFSFSGVEERNGRADEGSGTLFALRVGRFAWKRDCVVKYR